MSSDCVFRAGEFNIFFVIEDPDGLRIEVVADESD